MFRRGPRKVVEEEEKIDGITIPSSKVLMRMGLSREEFISQRKSEMDGTREALLRQQYIDSLRITCSVCGIKEGPIAYRCWDCSAVNPEVFRDLTLSIDSSSSYSGDFEDDYTSQTTGFSTCSAPFDFLWTCSLCENSSKRVSQISLLSHEEHLVSRQVVEGEEFPVPEENETLGFHLYRAMTTYNTRPCIGYLHSLLTPRVTDARTNINVNGDVSSMSDSLLFIKPTVFPSKDTSSRKLYSWLSYGETLGLAHVFHQGLFNLSSFPNFSLLEEQFKLYNQTSCPFLDFGKEGSFYNFAKNAHTVLTERQLKIASSTNTSRLHSPVFSLLSPNSLESTIAEISVGLYNIYSAPLHDITFINSTLETNSALRDKLTYCETVKTSILACVPETLFLLQRYLAFDSSETETENKIGKEKLPVSVISQPCFRLPSSLHTILVLDSLTEQEYPSASFPSTLIDLTGHEVFVVSFSQVLAAGLFNSASSHWYTVHFLSEPSTALLGQYESEEKQLLVVDNKSALFGNLQTFYQKIHAPFPSSIHEYKIGLFTSFSPSLSLFTPYASSMITSTARAFISANHFSQLEYTKADTLSYNDPQSFKSDVLFIPLLPGSFDQLSAFTRSTTVNPIDKKNGYRISSTSRTIPFRLPSGFDKTSLRRIQQCLCVSPCLLSNSCQIRPVAYDLSPHLPCCILPTSGSTDLPRAVVITHRQFSLGILKVAGGSPDSTPSVEVLHEPLSHLNGRGLLFSSLFRGARLGIFSHLNLTQSPIRTKKSVSFWEAIGDISPTHLGGVPRVWQDLELLSLSLSFWIAKSLSVAPESVLRVEESKKSVDKDEHYYFIPKKDVDLNSNVKNKALMSDTSVIAIQTVSRVSSTFSRALLRLLLGPSLRSISFGSAAISSSTRSFLTDFCRPVPVSDVTAASDALSRLQPILRNSSHTTSPHCPLSPRLILQILLWSNQIQAWSTRSSLPTSASTVSTNVSHSRILLGHLPLLQLHESYGTTETSTASKDGLVNTDVQMKLREVINPISGQVLFSPTDIPFPRGEIIISSPAMASGYIPASLSSSANVINNTNSGLNASGFLANGWYATGDLGIERNGRISVIARLSGGFKLANGEFVNPNVVENALQGVSSNIFWKKFSDYILLKRKSSSSSSMSSMSSIPSLVNLIFDGLGISIDYAVVTGDGSISSTSAILLLESPRILERHFTALATLGGLPQSEFEDILFSLQPRNEADARLTDVEQLQGYYERLVEARNIGKALYHNEVLHHENEKETIVHFSRPCTSFFVSSPNLLSDGEARKREKRLKMLSGVLSSSLNISPRSVQRQEQEESANLVRPTMIGISHPLFQKAIYLELVVLIQQQNS